MKEDEASRPYRQFDAQVDETKSRIIEGIETQELKVPFGTILQTLAPDTVKNNWVEQGIWNPEWTNMPQARWMHEKSPTIHQDPTRPLVQRPIASCSQP